MAIERIKGIERAGVDPLIPTSEDDDITKYQVVRMYVNPQNGRLVVDYEDND